MDYKGIIRKHFTHYQNNPSLWVETFDVDLDDIPGLSIEELATHADYVCKKMHDESSEHWHKFCLESLDIPEDAINQFNATSFANMAYLAIEGPDDLKEQLMMQFDKFVKLIDLTPKEQCIIL